MRVKSDIFCKRPKNSLILILIVALYHTSLAKELENSTSLEVAKRRPLQLENYFYGFHTPHEFDGHWVWGSDHLVQIPRNMEIVFYNMKTGQNETILSFKEITDEWDVEVVEVIFSKDLRYALVKAAGSQDWSITATSGFIIFDLKTRNSTALGPVTYSDEKLHLQQIQLVYWTPTGHGIVYVANNNIYYKPDAQPDTPIRQITSDGCEKSWIFNGLTTWNLRTGEGDAIDDVTSLWISPSSTHLVYYKYNDSLVPELQWPIYGEPDQIEQIYPEYRKVRYPMAGFNISVVDVYVVSLADESSTPIKLEFQGTDENDVVIKGGVTWCTNDKFLIATFNRQQTTGIWHLCEIKSAVCKQIYAYTQKNGWIDNLTAEVSEDGSQFVFVRPAQLEDEAWSYHRILLVNVENGKERVLTTGNMSVIEILGWDHGRNKIHFTATFWNGSFADPTQTHLYSVSVDTLEVKCITCGLTNNAGNPCLSNLIDLSENFTYFIHTCNGPDIPEIGSRYTKNGLLAANSGFIDMENMVLRNRMANKFVPTVKEYTVPVKNGFEARAKVYFPENLDPTKKYPLLVSVYAGPGSNEVTQAYKPSWEKTLVSRKNVIVAYIDGRGSGRQAAEFMFELHRKLGTAEIEDQIAVTKWLLENEPLIDPNKTSIWGWSYGGYATIKVLETDMENIFKCGIAVAPVTDWRRYLASYSECFMGLATDEDNFMSYNESRVTADEQVENLRNKEFLLIHGTADDRVHYMNSMLLARSLQKNDIMFQQLSYPDEGHGISEEYVKHMHWSMEQFLFKSCYKMPELVDKIEKSLF